MGPGCSQLIIAQDAGVSWRPTRLNGGRHVCKRFHKTETTKEIQDQSSCMPVEDAICKKYFLIQK